MIDGGKDTSEGWVAAFVHKVGLLPIIIAFISFPIVSFFSLVVTLDLPVAAISAESLARYSFFLASSIVATFAIGRIFDFVLSGLLTLAVEALAIVRGSVKIRSRKPSDEAWARYEIAIIRSLDSFLSARNTAFKHYTAAIAVSSFLYWKVFLGGNTYILYLALVCMVFLLATTGSLNRKQYPKQLDEKRGFLRRLRRARAFIDKMPPRIAEVEKRLEGHTDAADYPERIKTLAEMKLELLEASQMELEVRESLRGVRFVTISPTEIPSALLKRLRLSLMSTLENPIGLSTIVLAIAVYIGYARAIVASTSRPGEIHLTNSTLCGRILLIGDEGYFIRPQTEASAALYVSKQNFISVKFGDNMCETSLLRFAPNP